VAKMKTFEEYKADPHNCPFCGGEVYMAAYDFSGTHLAADLQCEDCGRDYMEEYNIDLYCVTYYDEETNAAKELARGDLPA